MRIFILLSLLTFLEGRCQMSPGDTLIKLNFQVEYRNFSDSLWKKQNLSKQYLKYIDDTTLVVRRTAFYGDTVYRKSYIVKEGVFYSNILNDTLIPIFSKEMFLDGIATSEYAIQFYEKSAQTYMCVRVLYEPLSVEVSESDTFYVYKRMIGLGSFHGATAPTVGELTMIDYSKEISIWTVYFSFKKEIVRWRNFSEEYRLVGCGLK